jgi:hypothetical protein
MMMSSSLHDRTYPGNKSPSTNSYLTIGNLDINLDCLSFFKGTLDTSILAASKNPTQQPLQ